MIRNSLFLGLVLALGLAGSSVHAADAPTAVPERSEGKADAPIVVQEFVSFTCPHCAAFTTQMLPQIEKDYVETGKVRIILRDFPMDGPGLHAGALARCMPEEQFFPFVKVLFGNQGTWATAADPDKILIQYATLGGLSADKAKACLDDKAMQDGLVAIRAEAEKKYTLQATPTFIFNDGAQKLEGIGSAKDFIAVVDKMLGAPKAPADPAPVTK